MNGTDLAAKPIDVCTIGNMVADVIVRSADTFPPVGEIEFVDSIAVQPGGNAVNTAIALGVLGQRPLPIGRVGRDGFGRLLKESMESAGASLRAVHDDEASTAVTVAGVRADGDRSFLHTLGANASVTAGDIPWDVVQEARIFHLSSVFVLPSFDGTPGVESLQRAKSLGLTTVLDVCWDPSERWMELLAEYLPHADYFLPNLDEARALTGLSEPGPIADAFLAHGCGTVVVKLGRDGCYYRSRDEERHIAGIAVSAVDSTGAGDAFGAGLMAALLRGYDGVSAARFANGVGARAVSAPGLSGLAPFEEIEQWSLQYKRGSDI